jgi:hypothetical protein
VEPRNGLAIVVIEQNRAVGFGIAHHDALWADQS